MKHFVHKNSKHQVKLSGLFQSNDEEKSHGNEINGDELNDDKSRVRPVTEWEPANRTTTVGNFSPGRG